MNFKLKLIIFTATSVSAIVDPDMVSAAPGKLLLKKTIESSLTDSRAPKQICEIYETEVKLTHTHGFDKNNVPFFSSTKTMAIDVTNSITDIIAKAAASQLKETASTICISPRLNIIGYLDNGQEYLLYASDGCKQPNQKRQSLEGDALRMFVFQYCPGT